MSYSAFLSAIFGKKPFWIYHVTNGTTERFYVRAGFKVATASPTPFLDRYPAVFEAADLANDVDVTTPVNHRGLRKSHSLERQDVRLEFPISDAFAAGFLTDTGYNTSSVTIYHGFAEDTDDELVTKFSGRVVGAIPTWGKMVLNCQSKFADRQRKAIPVVMQKPCRHALYGTECGVNEAYHQTLGLASDWTSPVVTVAEAALQANGAYSGGIIRFGSYSQFIRKHEYDQLTLLGPIPGLADEITASTYAEVLIAPGCPRTMTACETTFNNIARFGGWPWMSENVFDGRNPF